MLWNKEWGRTINIIDDDNVTKIYINIHHFAEALGNAIDAKDKYTYNHSQHVAVISYLITLGMGFTPRQADLIHIAGHLHDIGKIGVPDNILNKPGPLTEKEWQHIKKHPVIGADIVGAITRFQKPGSLRDMILYHHERYDGKGYPAELKGNEIPIGARIIAVADTFSAMTQDRPYRKGMPLDKAIQKIALLSGSQLDPLCVKVFLSIKDKIIGWMTGFNNKGP